MLVGTVLFLSADNEEETSGLLSFDGEGPADHHNIEQEKGTSSMSLRRFMSLAEKDNK